MFISQWKYTGAIAFGLFMSTSASAITFVGTGWTLDVTVTSNTPPGNWVNSFQDSDSARLGYHAPSTSVNTLWGPSTNPGIAGVTPNPNTVTGTYILTADAGYQINSIDLQGAGVWATTAANANGFANSSVTLDGVTTADSFTQTATGSLVSLLTSLGLPSIPNIPGAVLVPGRGGTWSANAADHVFAPGTLSYSGSFSFLNDPPNGVTTLAAMAGSAAFGPEFTISVSAIPEPHEYALMLSGLAITGLIARRRRKQ